MTGILLHALLGTLLALQATAPADEVESAEKRLAAAWNKHRSMTARIDVTRGIEGPGMEYRETGEGAVEMLKAEGKVLFRVEMKSKSMQKRGEQELAVEQTATTISDGRYAYSLTEMAGRKMAFKTEVDASMGGDPAVLLRDLRVEHELKVLPEETLGEAKVLVVEATPRYRSSMPGAASKTVCYFDEKNGCLLKMMVFGADDKPMATMTYADHKFDVPIDPKRFEFKPPEDVEVIDRTGGNP